MAWDPLQLLSYARQPLVGAFIGYITTDVAIRLLFRPLKAWRIFGVRIPLTPGVLPAKRHEFAEKVGKMVGSHLLTSGEVRQALLKDAFRRELQGAVNERLHDLLNRDFGTVASFFPPEFEGWMRDIVGRLRSKGMHELFAYLDSPACDSVIRDLLSRKLDEILTRNLESALTPSDFDSLASRLDEWISEFVMSPAAGKAAASLADRKMEEFLASGVTLRELIPKSLAEMISARLEEELGEMIERLIANPSFGSHLRANMEEGFKAAIGSLQGVSGFLAKLLDPRWIVSLFPEFVSRMELETYALLRDETTRKEISKALMHGIDRFLDQSVGNLMEMVPYRKAAALRRLARKQAVSLVRSRQVAALLTRTLADVIAGLRHRTFGSLITAAVSETGVHRLADAAAGEVLASLRSPAARQTLEETVEAKIEEWLFQRPVGQLAALVPANARDELAGMVYSQLAELLVAELPPLVDIMNIQGIVEDKVNSLDILDMEGLLLDIMKESFMFLNLFGALLGFLIGILNDIVPGFAG